MGPSRQVRITDTILRDAHQSLIATRMRLEDMLPAAQDLDSAGYFSLEVWGGATFDVCLRFLNENPWERLKALKRALPNTPLQMLLRGQNLVGYRHYPDDVVDAFIEKSRECGIDIFRIFDALNDIRNLTRAIKAAKRCGGTVEGTISYTVSPVHTIDQFVAFARKLKDEGSDLICIKDMAGMIGPEAAFELILAIKEEVGLPVHLHTHSASGMSPATYLRAAQAGVDVLDCALSPFSWGTSQPPTESIVSMLEEGGFSTGIDSAALYRAASHFQKVKERYAGILNPRSERVDTRILQHQIPGGMLSNLLSQLSMQGALDRLDEVLEETARVRRDLGYPPLVTPTSQIVGTQAVFNVLGGERYNTVCEEVRDYIRGKYGAAPGRIDPEVARKAIGDEIPIACRPADLLPGELDAAVKAVAPYSNKLEDALSYALFPQVALSFLKARAEGKEPPTTEPPPEQMNPKALGVSASKEGNGAWRVQVGPNIYLTQVESSTSAPGRRSFVLVVNGERIEVTLESRLSARRRVVAAGEMDATEGRVVAPMPGMVVRLLVKEGDRVSKGDVVAILEAMKMLNEIKASSDGVVGKVAVTEGQTLDKGSLILEICSS